MKQNPFEKMHELYKEQLNEENKKHNPEFNKSRLDAIMDMIREKKFTLTDIKYLNGYFIFATGDNSICHFKIEECPGWLFGIWLIHDEDKYNETNATKFSFFAQYEKFIDKFKPAASMISEDGSVYDTDDGKTHVNNDWKIIDNIEYIQEHPYLAIWRDIAFVDYNTTYISEKVAKRKVLKDLKDDIKYEKWQNKLDEKCKKQGKKVIKSFSNKITSVVIIDRGDGWSPRYVYDCSFAIGTKVDDIREIAYQINEVLYKTLTRIRERFEKKHKTTCVYSNVSTFIDSYQCYKNGNRKHIR